MTRQLTPEQKAKSEARKQQFRKIVKQVGEMSAVQKAELSFKIGAVLTAEGRALSLHNTYLLALQCPQATIVGGFKQWLKHGRAVRKGEHGHMIWFPRTGTKAEAATSPSGDADAAKESEGESVRFMIGTVFDISQTMEIENGQDDPIAQPAQAVALVPYVAPVAQPEPEKHWTAKVLELELV